MPRLTARGWGIAGAAALAVAAAAGVSGRQAEVILTGRVVDAVTGTPVADAVVTVSAGTTQIVEVGTNGQFSVSLPGHGVRTRMFAHAPGYLRGFPGQRGATDTFASPLSIEPTVGRPVEDSVIRLWRGASIAGTVVDEDQRPVAGARVIIMSRALTGSGYRWIATAVVSPFTDDLGQFDVPDLRPGSYLMAVRPPADPRVGGDVLPPVTFYPGTPVAAEAQVVPLGSGTDVQVRMAIDFSTVFGTVRGRLTGVDDPGGRIVHLVPEILAGEVSPPAPMSLGFGGTPLGWRTTRSLGDGTFAFRAVPPGRYRVKTWWPSETDPWLAIGDDFQRVVTYSSSNAAAKQFPGTRPGTPWIADVPVDVVGTDPVDITLPLSPGASIRGRVEFAGGKPPAANETASLAIGIRPADGAASAAVPLAAVEADGTFRSVDLPPGDYVIGVGQGASLPDGWHVTSVLARGVEVVAGKVTLDSTDVDGVVVRLSTRPAALAGSVSDSRGRPVSGARVIIFPSLASERDQFHALPAQRRVVQAMADLSGRFSVQLPSGGYLVAPVTGDLPMFWMAPDHLNALVSHATDVLVEDGRQATVNVTLP